MSTRSTRDPWVLDQPGRGVRARQFWLQALHLQKAVGWRGRKVTLCPGAAAHVRPFKSFKASLEAVSVRPDQARGVGRSSLLCAGQPAACFGELMAQRAATSEQKPRGSVERALITERVQHEPPPAGELASRGRSCVIDAISRKRKSEGPGVALVWAGSAVASECRKLKSLYSLRASKAS